MADSLNAPTASPAGQSNGDSAKSPGISNGHKPAFARSPSSGSSSQNGGRTSPFRDHREASPSQKDREERVRITREKQEYERHKKLDEIKQAAIAQESYRQQWEEDRKRRIQESRCKENDKQLAVNERRKQILDAEKDRREALLRRKMERESRLEAKKNAQRNAMSFFFGSTTPRLYETYEMKNSQSTVNLAATPEKRSASLNRTPNDIFSCDSPATSYPIKNMSSFTTSTSTPHNGDGSYSSPRADCRPAANLLGSGLMFGEDLMSKSCTSLSNSSSTFGRGRRKTDLRPTVPREKDSQIASTPRSKGSGGQMQRAISMSRLDQLAQPRRPTVRKTTAEPRPKSSMSEHSATSSQLSTATAPIRMRSSTPHKPRPLSMTASLIDTKPRTPRSTERQSASKTPRAKSATNTERKREAQKASTPTTSLNKATNNSGTPSKPQKSKTQNKPDIKPKAKTPSKSPSPQPQAESVSEKKTAIPANKPDIIPDENRKPTPSPPSETNTEEGEGGANNKPRITSEEQAKAALAEHRRQAREKMEREAAEEKARLEREQQELAEKLRREEEEQRLAELEAIRLAEEHRKIEEEKLQQAIALKQKQDEEERIAREKEEQLKAEREEAERQAREEAERLRKEKEEKLKQEEEERALRKKRVADILSRTRGKATTPTSETSASDVSTNVVSALNKINLKLSNDNEEQPSETENQSDIMDFKCEDSQQPGSLDSSSSANTVIFNGSGQPDLAEFDSLSSPDVVHTNGHHQSQSNSDENLLTPSPPSLVTLAAPACASSTAADNSDNQGDVEDHQLIDLPTAVNKNNQLDNSLFIQDLNSNSAPPFIAFQDNTTPHLSNKHDNSNTVADLLA